MNNNVFFHVSSNSNLSKAVIKFREGNKNVKYTVHANKEPLIVTFPTGQQTMVKIKAVKSFFTRVGTNKTYTKQIFVPNEDSIIDVFISIGKAVVQIDIKPRQ